MLNYRDYPELSAEFVARHPVDDPRFEPWLEAWYGAPVADKPWDMQFDETIGYPTGNGTFELFVARAWWMGLDLAERFTTEQIGQVLWEQHGTIDWYEPLSSGGRILWSAAHNLYATIFDAYANHSLGHLSETTGHFQGAIYMFWDVAAWYAGAEDATDAQRTAFLHICERALDSPKASVQESGLHGLGHATMYMPEAKRAIERFLLKGKPRRKELRKYAEAALGGEIN